VAGCADRQFASLGARLFTPRSSLRIIGEVAEFEQDE
jgi:hypothetical protein